MTNPTNSIPGSRLDAAPVDWVKRTETRILPSRKEAESPDPKNNLIRDQVILTSNPPSGAAREESATVRSESGGDIGAWVTTASVIFEQIKSQLERRLGIQREITGDAAIPNTASRDEWKVFAGSESTANQILRYASGFWPEYATQHPEASKEDNLDRFTRLLGEEVETGFDNAWAILSNHDSAPEIGEYLQRTYEMVLERLKEFREEFLQQWNQKAETPPPDIPNAGLDLTQDFG